MDETEIEESDLEWLESQLHSTRMQCPQCELTKRLIADRRVS